MKSVIEKKELSACHMLSEAECISPECWEDAIRDHLRALLDKRRVVANITGPSYELEDGRVVYAKTYALGVNSFNNIAVKNMIRTYFSELNRVLGENIVVRRAPSISYGVTTQGTPEVIISGRLATIE